MKRSELPALAHHYLCRVLNSGRVVAAAPFVSVLPAAVSYGAPAIHVKRIYILRSTVLTLQSSLINGIRRNELSASDIAAFIADFI